MLLTYPLSIPVAFDNFPPALDIRMGPMASDLIPWASLGTKFILTRTPKCGVPQGSYIVGESLPDCSMVYSDTGSDDDFTIKASFLGYGTFYKMTNADQYLRFLVYKAISIKTSVGEKIFGDTFDCETLIPSTTDISAIFSYDGSIAQYTEAANLGSDPGTIVIGGVTYKFSDGASITISSATGGTYTIRYVGGTFVVG